MMVKSMISCREARFDTRLVVVAITPPSGPPRVRLYGESGTELVPAALRTAADLGAVVTNLRLLRPSLEDVFIHLTGRALR